MKFLVLALGLIYFGSVIANSLWYLCASADGHRRFRMLQYETTRRYDDRSAYWVFLRFTLVISLLVNAVLLYFFFIGVRTFFGE